MDWKWKEKRKLQAGERNLEETMAPERELTKVGKGLPIKRATSGYNMFASESLSSATG